MGNLETKFYGSPYHRTNGNRSVAVIPRDYLGKYQPSSGVLLLFDETDVRFNSVLYLMYSTVDFAVISVREAFSLLFLL
jgi:hypothetical protein